MGDGASGSSTGDPIGWNRAAVESWVSERVPTLRAPWTWTQLQGGHSNLTYRVDGADGSAVVRRPPLGTLLPKAHDMGREWAYLSALADTEVPVAEPLAFCEDTTITGAHFYVMSLVDGRTMYDRSEVDDWVPLEHRMTMAESWIDTLAALHSLDPDDIGVGELARRSGYVERQLRTWYGSWTASAEAAAMDDPEIHALHDALVASVPEPQANTVVHGDYGTHNVMFTSSGQVAAVVDWEIATLGDPLADLGYSLNAWARPDDPLLENPDFTTLAEGFPGREHLIARYGERTGRDLSELPWYLTFNAFKTACILHGVYARYRNGQKAIEAEDLALLQDRTNRAIQRALLFGRQSDLLPS